MLQLASVSKEVATIENGTILNAENSNLSLVLSMKMQEMMLLVITIKHSDDNPEKNRNRRHVASAIEGSCDGGKCATAVLLFLYQKSGQC